jgi:polar amino acid transport system substrate-binding protein
VVDGKKVIGYGATTFRLDDTAFRDAYNKELAEFVKTPEFWDIAKRNGFSKEGIDLALQMTADQACQ